MDKPTFAMVIIDRQTNDVYTFADWECTDLVATWVSQRVLDLITQLGHTDIVVRFQMA